MRKHNLLICDDNQASLDRLSKLVMSICSAEQQEINLILCTSGTELLACLNADVEVDIFLLDIEMPGLTGLELGHLIREHYKLRDAVIFFVSNHTSYMPGAFEVQPRGYIEKSAESEIFHRQLVKAFNQLNRVAFFEYRDGRDTSFVKARCILYLESNKKLIHLTHYMNGEYQTVSYYSTLRAELEKLDSNLFVQPHASYIVNLEQIGNITKRSILMPDGRMIDIARNKYSDFMTALFKYNSKR